MFHPSNNKKREKRRKKSRAEKRRAEEGRRAEDRRAERREREGYLFGEGGVEVALLAEDVAEGGQPARRHGRDHFAGGGV
jgi:hypothetical protein